MGLEINMGDMSLLYGAFVTLFIALFGMQKAKSLFMD